MRMRVATLGAILAALALIASGCDSQQRDLLTRAFQHPVNDARLDMAASVTQAGRDVLTLTATGPYHSNGQQQLPSFDFTIDGGLHVVGQTHSLTFEAISTGEDVYVRYAGVAYDVGKDRVAAYMRRAQRQASKIGTPRSLGDLDRLGLHLENWFPNSQIVGDETFHGEQVTHLHGDIDVKAVLGDVSGFFARYGTGARAAGLRHVTPQMLGQISKAITNPTYDVLVDKASGGFRRIAAQAGIDVPGGPQLGVNMRFDWLDVGQPQTIAAPTDTHPISELLDLLRQKYGMNVSGRLGSTHS